MGLVDRCRCGIFVLPLVFSLFYLLIGARTSTPAHQGDYIQLVPFGVQICNNPLRLPGRDLASLRTRPATQATNRKRSTPRLGRSVRSTSLTLRIQWLTSP